MSDEVRGWLFVAGQVRQLEEAEQLAVEQEDFESAANLSSELDVLRFTTDLPHDSVTCIPNIAQNLLINSAPDFL